ncbi:tRNA1(Val) (adenine(37)-N6)-methyltransferase [Pedobacter agri]|uniref:tRNA1(Val) (adenine(37)-N6)-methyltransferase n=1 Tax=Pedobacter agri TaxID=454586 RepID=UPI00292F8B30|nr:methyltransferase [Pedobacter agri]
MSIFKFKQFEVDQSGCAMKINTDGVLIGAMATSTAPKNVLDIGTGTGVIALMLAQRYQEAEVHAVEIDQLAAEAARKNFEHSKFSERLSVDHISISNYYPSQQFDLIVSNPPFFVNDLKNKEERKGIARHADENFFELLVQQSNTLLNEKGILYLILPVKQALEVVSEAAKYQLLLTHQINIHSDENKPAFRQIIGLSKTKQILVETNLYIYESMGKHTPEYKRVLSDFFLAF